MMTASVAILTPTYNRAHTLTRLYESLINQTCYHFCWYIVDDGSDDNTKDLCKSFFSDGNFEIRYIYKENGGKHTALNVGLDYITEELTMIVDSDDYLTADAIESVISDWSRYRDMPEVGGLCYYKLRSNGTVNGDQYSSDEFVDTYFAVRINRHVSGDKAEVYRTEVLNAHRFPVFPGERFLSEAVVWSAINQSGYKLAYIAKGIYVCEYLPDGLTKSGRIHRLKNPRGTMEHAKAFLHKEVKLSIRIKYILLYIASAFFAKVPMREAFHLAKGHKCLFALEFLPACMLTLLWKMRYKI